MKTSTTFVLLLSLSSWACSPIEQKGDTAAIFKQTKAANDASLQGHIEKDAKKIVAVYTDDAIVLPPGGVKPIVGIDSIRKYYQQSLAGPGRSVSIKTENIRFDVSSETDATELGRYVIDYQASDTSAVTPIKGEMLIVWKKVDGQWKIYLDMWH